MCGHFLLLIYFTSEPRCLDGFLNTYFMTLIKADIFVSKPFSEKLSLTL